MFKFLGLVYFCDRYPGGEIRGGNLEFAVVVWEYFNSTCEVTPHSDFVCHAMAAIAPVQ